MSESTPAADADVIVVGAGPAGSTTAFYLAQAGYDVLLLEKTRFPREKVCGDGLTPRAVKELIAMGVDVDGPGWIRNKGLRVVGAGMRLELAWPELSSYPDFGLVRTRMDFDQILASNAERGGVRLLQGVTVTGPVLDARSGHITGVTAKRDGESSTYRSRLVVAADGNSSRLSLSMGLHKRDDRPMGVAVRTYFTSPRHDDDWLESWLELWDTEPDGSARLLPGYGWVFGVGDGTSNVGLGLLNTSEAFQNLDYRDLLRRWVRNMPAEWEFSDETMTGPVRGAALPMAFNRQPHYTQGLVLVGDAGGMINPFNGEGIAYAMETGRIAADVITTALSAATPAGRERVLRAYPGTLKDAYGGYFTLGRLFVEAIGKPGVMGFLTRHGLPHPTLMRFALKLLANLTDRRGDASDRIINALSKVTPPA
ncbi:drug:proton antiporter [Sphaerisporangium krabiense]|uniref:Geranylgeranyl reductase family protein n=1 Tax=Sphaerisporangium krabiense TaxID=763782 RepID=A0A7W9DNK5_9ACTN|nr:geranylgeranyl reductase family protein [Sphaerisporangium krabiense]MBB5625492.1 geranylgeranyl reductase family protein [Sphaerisporangium krabiense]GII63180.1 drug:proton antiporter [Sphaerisporangium krabiense]